MCIATDSINDVEYEEVDGKPGISIEHSDGTKCWSPVKLSKKRVKAVSSASSESDVEIKECLCVDYQKRDDVYTWS